MHEYEVILLEYLKEVHKASLDEILKSTGLNRDSVLWAIENLKAVNAIETDEEKGFEYSVSDEASGYSSMFPEEELLKKASNGNFKIDGTVNRVALSWAKRNGWIEIKDNEITITELGRAAVSSHEYKQRTALQFVISRLKASEGKTAYITDAERSGIEEGLNELKSRRLIEEKRRNRLISVKATELGLKMLNGEASEKSIGMLTRESIKSGEWEKLPLRAYDVNAPVENIYPARRHPMKEFMKMVRDIWIGQGFIETVGPIIESAFWNFDALFSPQDHPTRDMQDTFFLSNPNIISNFETDLIKSVGRMHKKGWNNWNAKASEQAVLRTHTTSVSAHNIRNFRDSEGLSYPLKLFSIGRVFRNESIDYKHLAELHQLDGIVIGKDLGVAHLKGTLEQFYKTLGFKVSFKPSYFPFVEPGLEVNYYDEEHGDWIELCGGGLIRKEITKALGTNMRVIAWGMGLDRLMFKYLGIGSLSELYKNDIGFLRKRRPIA